MNLYTLYHEADDTLVPEDKQFTVKAFTDILIQLLMRQIVTHEKRPYKKRGKFT